MGMDRDDLELFGRSLAAATAASATGHELDAALAGLGWTDALDVDPEAAVSLLFEQQGRAVASSSALGWVVLHALGLGDEAAVVLPALGGWRPSAPEGDSLHGPEVCGLGLASVVDSPTVVVVVGDAGRAEARRLPVADLTLRAVHGIDPDLGLVEVRGGDGGEELGLVDWPAAVRRAQLALGHELVGASRQMLDLARVHALERIQFGQPIAMFQAVRHRLAEALVAIEMAQAALDAAWLDPAPHHAATAKALAGRGARTVARHSQQVLAGIGYTTEHPFHRYLRRVLVLDELFGSARTLARELGEELIRTRQLPPRLAL